jgi:hypothetical protein
MTISFGRYIFMLTLPLIASLIVNLLTLLNFREPINVNDELKASLSANIDWQNAIYISGPNNEVSLNSIEAKIIIYFYKIALIAAFVFMMICYAINLYCGTKVVKFVAARAFNPRTKKLNQQLTKTLIILVCKINYKFIQNEKF